MQCGIRRQHATPLMRERFHTWEGRRLRTMARLKRFALLLIIAFALCQCLPMRHMPVAQKTPGNAVSLNKLDDPEVETILSRSCTDCHSSHAGVPWYGRVAPASWLVAYHVNRGIRKWDIAAWDTRKPLHGEMEDICDAVSDGGMPLRTYTWIHPRAKLSDREITALCSWADSPPSTAAATR
jgi:hypothetical protein